LACLSLCLGDAIYLAILWPDWQALQDGPVPKSQFIASYEARQQADRSLPKVRWSPVSLSELPLALQHAVVAAEDGNFYRHHGIDPQAIVEAVRYNLAQNKLSLGGSTISQQTVKNLFLSSARTPIRKWHELVLTWRMEQNLPKSRILALYLNIAQFGDGVFGAEAAAQTYFNKHASSLTFDQCVALAASLPSPRRNNPSTNTELFLKRKERIQGFLRERSWAENPSPVESGELAASPEPEPAVESREAVEERAAGASTDTRLFDAPPE